MMRIAWMQFQYQFEEMKFDILYSFIQAHGNFAICFYVLNRFRRGVYGDDHNRIFILLTINYMWLLFIRRMYFTLNKLW